MNRKTSFYYKPQKRNRRAKRKKKQQYFEDIRYSMAPNTAPPYRGNSEGKW